MGIVEMMKHLLFTLCDWVSALYEHIHKKSDLMSLTRHISHPSFYHTPRVSVASGKWFLELRLISLASDFRNSSNI